MFLVHLLFALNGEWDIDDHNLHFLFTHLKHNEALVLRVGF